MSNLQRIEWIDKLKGIGIILVLLGHAVFPLPLKIVICSVHMPLFFFLSGITLNIGIDFKAYIMKRIKGILIPLFFFSIFNIIIDKILYNVLIGNNMELGKAITLFPGILIQMREGEFSSVLWYLSCLFVSEILIYFICKLSHKSQIVVVISGVIVTYIYLKFIGILLPWGIEISLIAVSFIYLGKLFTIYETSIRKALKSKYAIIYFISSAVVSIYNSKVFIEGDAVSMAYSRYGNLLLFYISALLGILGLVALVQNNNFRSKELQYIGRNSLIYYSFHYIVFIIPQIVSFQFLGKFTEGLVGSFIIGMGYLLISLPVLHIISYIINDKMSFMLGKSTKMNKITKNAG